LPVRAAAYATIKQTSGGEQLDVMIYNVNVPDGALSNVVCVRMRATDC
jgi:hypothetical protein